MEQQTDIYKIAINLIPHVGDVVAKRLISYCGSLDAIFNEKEKNLAKIPGVGSVIASSIAKNTKKKEILIKAEKELQFNNKYGVKTLFFLDDDFPKRLIYCEDSPITLFTLGNFDCNHKKVLSIVGTRKATNYGKEICNNIINDFKNSGFDIQIASGLAYGIDICAHKTAIDNNLQTIAVLAHGLDTIYPTQHKKYAKQMLENGGLITEFLTNTTPDKQNFVKRNRIIAGIADATLVIESDVKGGSLITADIANSYNRDVFAIPGKISVPSSAGTNFLIKTNRAALVESASDIANFLNWNSDKKKDDIQTEFFINLEPDELLIAKELKAKGDLSLDIISLLCKMPVSKVSSTLLNMEFKGAVKAMPGKIFKICVNLPPS